MSYIQQITKKAKVFLWVAILLNVVAVVLYGGAGYIVKQKSNHVAKMKETIQSAIDEKEYISTIRSIAEDTLKEREIIDGYFTENNDVVDFMEKLEELAVHSGVSMELSSVDVKVESINDIERGVLFLGISSSGTWNEIMYFLDLIQTLPDIVDMKDVRMNKADKKDDVQIWRGNFEFSLESFLDDKSTYNDTNKSKQDIIGSEPTKS